MRPVGLTFAAILTAAPVAWAQAPAGGAAPRNLAPVNGGDPNNPRLPTPGAAPAAPPAADPQVDNHLLGWQQKMAGTINFRADFTLTRKENTFNKEQSYAGSVTCMKPNFAALRLQSAGNPADFEYYLCNGASVYHYDGLKKTVTDYKLAAGAAGADNLMLDFISGMKAADVKQRFEIKLDKEAEFYVYLSIKPRLPKDRQEFDEVKFALYGPKTAVAYLPAQVWLLKPNGDTENWLFKNPQINIAGVGKDDFKFQKPPGDWQVRQAAPPGAPAPPAPPPAKGRP